MIKSFSKLMVVGAAIAALAGSVAIAEAGSILKNTDAPAVKSPGGTILGSATLYAVVNSDGTIARGDGNNNAGSPGKLGTGTYDIRFFRNITMCGYVATVGLSGTSGSSAPGMVTVVGRAGTTNGLFIQTFDASGAVSDRGFHVFVNC